MSMITYEMIKKCPKVELHDHLDGGLRVETIIELAKKDNIALPCYDVDELREYLVKGCQQKSLKLYLEAFAVTTAVMQSRENLVRVAREAVLDLEGLEEGKKESGTYCTLILCAMRNEEPSSTLEIAELAVAFREKGVVGFDIAGDEYGHPPKKHIEAFRYIRNKNFNITIHAGEAFGVESIWQAIQLCGAHRIGHGVRLVEDMLIEGGAIRKMGSLSHFINDMRIPLEMCLTSNVGTGAVENYQEHPFPIFFKSGFRVFLCSDNRLMSDTNLTKEMNIAVKEYGLNIRDLEKITINAMKSAFIHHDEKIRIIYDVIKSGYNRLREEYSIQ